jgi:hypothetical protein
MMQLNNKQLQVLDQLKQQKSPISMTELMSLLGDDFSERSVRRWLVQLSTNQLVTISGNTRSTKYTAITQQKNSTSKLFSPESQTSIDYVHQPLFNRQPVTYNSAWLESYRPNISSYLPKTMTDLMSQQGTRESIDDPAGTYARKIYNRLLIDLSYNSSRLEGNTYSLSDTEKLVIDGVANTQKHSQESIMILNHKEAIRFIVDNSHRIKIEYNDICTLHYLLSDGLIQTKYSGKMRDHAVRISASTYITPEGTDRLEKQLKQICLKAENIHNPFEQSFFLLVHVAYLQAFTDVNKRTSRLSANIPLIKNNLTPLSFNSIEKDDYASAMLAIYELNDTKPLADLFQFSYLRTCQEYDATVEAVGFDEIRVRYRTQRREVVRSIIINKLTKNALTTFISERTQQLIPSKDQIDFIEDINEDLKELSPQTISGLGITIEELNYWLGIK